MISEPCSQPHDPEQYRVLISFHPDGTLCVELEYPDHRTQEEAREALAMAGEVAEVPDAVMAITRSGHLVTQRRAEP